MTVFSLTSGRHTRIKWTDTNAAGAIHSLEWPVNDATKAARQFLDCVDHGRMLQSAYSNNPSDSESCNPTEGGGVMDGSFQLSEGVNASSSKLLRADTCGFTLQTANRMAFWNPVGGRNLSNYVHAKRVIMDNGGVDGWIVYDVTFSLPNDVADSIGQFEWLTAYMPSIFSKFYGLNRANRSVFALDDGPGEQPYPVIFADPTGEYAMGVWGPAWGDVCPAIAWGGYGRWRNIVGSGTNKWNVVSRVHNPAPGSVWQMRIHLAVGTLAHVIDVLCK